MACPIRSGRPALGRGAVRLDHRLPAARLADRPHRPPQAGDHRRQRWSCSALWRSILYGPPGVFPPYSLALLAGIASGAAMIPYTVIKEANRPEHSGTATGVINFLNFSLTALLGPMFAARLMAVERRRRARHLADYQATFTPLLFGVALAILLTLLLRETGPEGARRRTRTPIARTRDRTEPQHGELHVDDGSGTQAEGQAKAASARRSSRACGPRKSTSATSSSTITSPITATSASSPARPSGRSGIWKKLTDLFVEERKKGVLDVSQIPSSITAHDAGYIDKKNELIVGLQTDAPLKRAIMPNGGLKMVTNGLEAFGFKPDPQVVEIFTKYRKTHNAGVFDAYTARRPPLPQLARPDRPSRRLWPRPDHRRLPARRALRRRPADRAQEGRRRPRSTSNGRPTRSSATARS